MLGGDRRGDALEQLLGHAAARDSTQQLHRVLSVFQGGVALRAIEDVRLEGIAVGPDQLSVNVGEAISAYSAHAGSTTAGRATAHNIRSCRSAGATRGWRAAPRYSRTAAVAPQVAQPADVLRHTTRLRVQLAVNEGLNLSYVRMPRRILPSSKQDAWE